MPVTRVCRQPGCFKFKRILIYTAGGNPYPLGAMFRNCTTTQVICIMEEKLIHLTAGAVSYPSKIIIETRNMESQNSFYSTDDISVLEPTVGDETLSKMIQEH